MENNKNNISDIEDKYLKIIENIYAKYHVNPFEDIQKHNDGIIKAMIEFAIVYSNDCINR